MSKKDAALDPLSPEDWQGYVGDLQKETQRGAAIVGGALLDDLLLQLIASYLVDDKLALKELLVNPYSPLSTFASRIAAAYSLGLITRVERHDLKLIEDIRNEFAHRRPGRAFATDPVATLVAQLQAPDLLPDSLRRAFAKEPRQVFINVVSMLATFLDTRRRTAPSRLVPPRPIVLLEADRAA